MAKFYLKSMFGYAILKDMHPGEEVNVACQDKQEYNSIRSLVCQYAKAHPRDDVSKYSTDIEKQGTGYIVTVTAVV